MIWNSYYSNFDWNLKRCSYYYTSVGKRLLQELIRFCKYLRHPQLGSYQFSAELEFAMNLIGIHCRLSTDITPYALHAVAIPLWRNSASVVGSRPRNAINDSSAGRLPPTARISFRKRAPASPLTPLPPLLSSNRL